MPPGEDAAWRGESSGRLDADAVPLAILLAYILGKTVEGAGAVRDLVHQDITEDWHDVTETRRLFEAAMDAVPEAPADVGGAFQKALRAASKELVPGVDAANKIITEEMNDRMYQVARNGMFGAASDAFAAAFPGEALAATGAAPPPEKDSVPFHQRRSIHFMRRSREPTCHLRPGMRALHQIALRAYDAGASGAGVAGKAKEALERSGRAATWRTVAQADIPDATFGICAAAAAVIAALIRGRDFRYLVGPLREDCARIAREMSNAGGISVEQAALITEDMRKGALECRNDPIGAAGEVVARARSMAQMRFSRSVATVSFQAMYELMVGAVWAASGDRSRFESVYESALKAAGSMDPDIHHLFDPLNDEADAKPEMMSMDAWYFFYDASGRDMSEWAEIARRADYRGAALLPENAPIIDAYRSFHEAAIGAATGAASIERRARSQP